MKSPCWMQRYCRSTPRHLFPRRPTPASSLDQLSVVSRGGRALSKRYFKLLSQIQILMVDVSCLTCEWRIGRFRSHSAGVFVINPHMCCFSGCLQKRRDRAAEESHDGETSNCTEASSATEDISVPKDLDLIALPQLCFPGTVCFLCDKLNMYTFWVEWNAMVNICSANTTVRKCQWSSRAAFFFLFPCVLCLLLFCLGSIYFFLLVSKSESFPKWTKRQH